MLGATVFNIILTFLSFVVVVLLYLKFLAPLLPDPVAPWGVPLCFVLSLALSFLAYRAIVTVLFKKFDMEKYFDPIFGKKRKAKRLE